VKRRDFIALLGGAAAWPLAARAQQPAQLRRVGMLIGYAENDPETQARLTAFRQGLERLGWIEGHTVRIDYRFAPARPDQAQRFAKELVALRPDILVGNSTPATAAFLRETRTIPDRIRGGFRSRGQRLRRQRRAAGWQHHRFHQFRAVPDREVGWNCSRRSRPASCASRSYSTRRPPLVRVRFSSIHLSRWPARLRWNQSRPRVKTRKVTSQSACWQLAVRSRRLSRAERHAKQLPLPDRDADRAAQARQAELGRRRSGNGWTASNREDTSRIGEGWSSRLGATTKRRHASPPGRSVINQAMQHHPGALLSSTPLLKLKRV